MRWTTTAASSRSWRCLGNSLPRLGSPTWWPARPMRCRPRLTAPGDSTWTTRSTAPMSMPSSRLDVATRPRRRPDLSSSSICSRRSRDRDPWWALTSSSDSAGSEVPSASAARLAPSCHSSLSRVASRSDRRRALTKMSVERWDSTSSSRRGWMAGQIDRRAGPAAAGPVTGSPSMSWPSSAMSSTGTTTSTSSGLRTPASTMVTGRGRRPSGVSCGAPEEAGHHVERALGGGQADALGRAPRRCRPAVRATGPGASPAWWAPASGSRRR